MELNKNTLRRIENLSNRNKFVFSLSCSERVIKLYNLFDDVIINENLKSITTSGKRGSFLLNEIIEKYFNLTFDELSKKDVIQDLETCLELIPTEEYEGDYETSIAQYIAGCVENTLKFASNIDVKYVSWCSDYLIEILNIVELEYFYQNDLEGDEEEYLDLAFEKEIVNQNTLIDLLQEDVNLLKVREFNKTSEIKFKQS